MGFLIVEPACGAQALGHVGSVAGELRVVVAHQLPHTMWIFLDQGWNSCPPALVGRFLTAGLPHLKLRTKEMQKDKSNNIALWVRISDFHEAGK